MEHEGIDLADQDRAFDLSALGVKKSDDVDNVGLAESSKSGNSSSDSEATDDEGSDYAELLEKHLDSMYEQYLTANKDDVEPTARRKKLAKVVKRAIAAESHMEDIKMYDGDSSAYAKLLNVEKVSLKSKRTKTSHFVLSVPGLSMLLFSCQTWETLNVGRLSV